jgi:hypothetical protein
LRTGPVIEIPACLQPVHPLYILAMKKLLLCSVLAAFACVSAVQAGEECAKAKSTCCSAKAKAVVKKADVSVRGATLLVRR